MRRREVLARAGSLAAAAALAGCLSGGGGDPATTDPTPSPTETTTATATTGTPSTTATTTAAPSLVGRSFRITDAGCGGGRNEATANLRDGRVVVEGTISAKNACQGARLAGATYDPDADELAVSVETYRRTQTCAQCIVDVAYSATLDFEGGAPGRVVVRHDSQGRSRTVLETTL